MPETGACLGGQPPYQLQPAYLIASGLTRRL